MLILALLAYLAGSIMMFGVLLQVSDELEKRDSAEVSRVLAVHISSILWPATLLAAAIITLVAMVRSLTSSK